MEKPRKDAGGPERDQDPSPRSTLLHGELTREILRAFYSVHFVLGYGFLESVYRGALAVELRERGLAFELEAPIPVRYKGHQVGHFRADMLVEARVVLELKACLAIAAPERQQLLNYLRGTGLEVGLLLHFGPRAGVSRMVMSQELHKKKIPRSPAAFPSA